VLVVDANDIFSDLKDCPMQYIYTY